MTLQDLITKTRDYIDEPTPGNWTDATITRFINDGQQIIESEIVHEYEDYFEIQADLNATGGGLVPGQEFYLLPSDFLKFKRIERTDTGEVIHPIDQNEKVSLLNGLTPILAGGTVLQYYVTGNNVGFSPTPTVAIPIRMTYIQRLPDLVNLTDVSQIPAEHHLLLSVYSAIQCFIKDESDPSELRQEWSAGLDRIRRTLRGRQVQDPKHVRRVDSSYSVLY